MYDSETIEEARLPFPSSIQDDKERWLLTSRGMHFGGTPVLMIALLIVVVLTSVSFVGFSYVITNPDLLAIATLAVLVTLTLPTLFVYVQARRVLLILGVVTMLSASGFTLVLGLLA